MTQPNPFAAAARLGLYTTRHAAVLLEVARQGNRTTVALGRALDLSGAATCRAVQALAEAGLVSNAVNGQDRRLRDIHLTDLGRRVVEELHRQMAPPQPAVSTRKKAR
jgi:DNA-binding MarR family transcriptional regulator